MRTIYYEDETMSGDNPLIFLAGPTVRGSDQADLVSWRKEAIHEFEKHDLRCTLAIPEFRKARWQSNLATHDILEWEYKNLCLASVVMFWIPRTERLIGLTTNHEHGYWLGRDISKCIYGRPDDALSIAYTDFMWKTEWARQFDADIPPLISNTLKDTVAHSVTAVRFNQILGDLYLNDLITK